VSLFIRAPDLGFLKPLCSKARFFILDPARKIRDINDKPLVIAMTPFSTQLKEESHDLMSSLKFNNESQHIKWWHIFMGLTRSIILN
jgi:hypothetical protein